MAERAHPDDIGFQDKYGKRKLLGIIPWKKRMPNPYRDAVFWRYSLVADRCQDLRTLDVPCGMGWGTSMLKGCSALYGLDISEEAIAEASDRYGEHAKFQVGSMSRLPFPAASLDLISCLEGIEHVPKELGGDFLVEASRVLVPGGLMIISSPHCNDAPHSGNPYHIHEYQPEEIKSILMRHFLIEEQSSRVVDNLTISIFYCRNR